MTDLIERARAGDALAFEQLMEPHRHELQVHCYRMLGSLQDAEDALQETLLAAWRSFGRFEGRASVRTWMYQIATNRCLNALRSARRRPSSDVPPHDRPLPEPSRLGEVHWIQPYPDSLLEGVADVQPGPDARIESREAISLAFVTTLQRLPPLQRAVVVLRDVLGYPAKEVAGLLETTEQSVNSALKRARAGLRRFAPEPGDQPPPAPGSAAEREVVERLTTAYEAGDFDAVVSLLTEDVVLAMPPVPIEYVGRDVAAEFLRAVVFRPGRSFRMVETRANGQPAMGFYVVDPVTGIAHASGLLVCTLAGQRVSSLIRFDITVLDRFGLPRTLGAYTSA
jgi:RNA polymerase sigma-70 factor (ECF subfamily)